MNGHEQRKALAWSAFGFGGQSIPYAPYAPDFAPWALRAGEWRITNRLSKSRPWTLTYQGVRETNNFVSWQSAMRAAERKAFSAEVAS